MNINHTYRPLGDFIRPVDIRNKDLSVTKLLGLSIEKCFIPSIANTIGTDMSSYKIVKQNQFAYGPVTSRNGDKITIALYDGTDNAIISQAYSVFEITNTDELNPKYLFMWFSRPEFDRYARYKSHGSAREIFDWQTMCETMIPVPSIDEQRRIVSEYETVQRRIDNNRQLINKLEETAQTLYKKMFVEGIDKENLPEGWRMGKLGEVCSVKSGYAFSSDNWQNKGIPVVRIGDIYDNTIGTEKCTCVSNNNLPQNKIYKANKGNIVIAMTGATIGKIAIIPSNDIWINQRVGLFNNTIEQLPYLYLTLQQEVVQNEILNKGGGSAQANISNFEIENLIIIIPNNKDLEAFNKKCLIIIQNIMNCKEENKKILTLQKLMLSGMGR